MAAYDDLDVKRIFTVGILSVVVTAVTALAVQVLYYSMQQWQRSETAASSSFTRQNRILEEQSAQISSYGVDESTGNITIPIQRAIELVVEESRGERGDETNQNKTAEAETDTGKTDSDET